MAFKKIHRNILKGIVFKSSIPSEIWVTNDGIAIETKDTYTHISRFIYGIYDANWWRKMYRMIDGGVRITDEAPITLLPAKQVVF